MLYYIDLFSLSNANFVDWNSFYRYQIITWKTSVQILRFVNAGVFFLPLSFFWKAETAGIRLMQGICLV